MCRFPLEPLTTLYTAAAAAAPLLQVIDSAAEGDARPLLHAVRRQALTPRGGGKVEDAPLRMHPPGDSPWLVAELAAVRRRVLALQQSL